MVITKDKNNIIQITIPITRYKMLIFAFGTSSIVLLFYFFSVLYSAIFRESFKLPADFFAGFLVFCLIAIYASWFINGTEKIIFKGSVVKLVWSNGIFSYSKTLNACEISNVLVRKKTFASGSFVDIQHERIRENQRAFPLWSKMGKIAFDHGKKKITFFNGLNNVDAEEIVHIIKSEIEERCSILKSGGTMG